MRNICVITGTRAEYGLLYWTIKLLSDDPLINLQICVTGMHLSPEFGLTYKQIQEDGFEISAKIETLLSSDSSIGISKSIGLGVIGFAEAFDKLKPDIILILGDRFEIFAAAAAAMISRIPIAHCHGGEATEGLIDESIRHSITKMSHLHFTSTDEYRNRVIQLGEAPNRVFNVGALGIENINKLKLLKFKEFEQSINFKLGKVNFLVTFHPVTLEHSSAEIQFRALLNVLGRFKGIHIIFTKPNADNNGRIIINMIDEFVYNNTETSISFISLGQLRYLSAIKHVDLVIGNSSSGLLEVPSFKKATINIGDRQRGRIKALSVIDCEADEQSILNAIEKALATEFQKQLITLENPYGKNNSSEMIVDLLKSTPLNNILKKEFHNIKIK
jgi:GDP/UDP-N,N'-diacetylbacillosamine 2-epimerase (hydrolysing)